MKKFLGKLWEALKSGGTPATIKRNEESQSKPIPITSQEVVDQVLEHYKKRFIEFTTRTSMGFPTSFWIYLHPLDYNEQNQRFPMTAKEIVIEINKINREEKKKYPGHKPHANHWLFQFVKFVEGSNVDNIAAVQIGKLQVASTLFPRDFIKDKDSVGNDPNVMMTRMSERTIVEKLDVNIDAFLGMDMLENDQFRFKLNENYEDVTYIPKNERKGETLSKNIKSDAFASLVCNRDFITQDESGNVIKRGNTYLIMVDYIEISGTAGHGLKGSHIAKIDSPVLQNPHMHIKHEGGNFYLAAFGKVQLNEEIVPKSDGDPQWIDLPNYSSMILNAESPNSSGMIFSDEISIEFKIIKN